MSFNDEDDDNSEENKYAPTISKDDNDLRKMLNDMSEIDK